MTRHRFKTVNPQHICTVTVTLRNPYSKVPDPSLAGRFVSLIPHGTGIQGIRLLLPFGTHGLRTIAASVLLGSPPVRREQRFRRKPEPDSIKTRDATCAGRWFSHICP